MCKWLYHIFYNSAMFRRLNTPNPPGVYTLAIGHVCTPGRAATWTQSLVREALANLRQWLPIPSTMGEQARVVMSAGTLVVRLCWSWQKSKELLLTATTWPDKRGGSSSNKLKDTRTELVPKRSVKFKDFDNSNPCWMLRTGTVGISVILLCSVVTDKGILLCLGVFELRVCVDWRSDSQMKDPGWWCS